MNIIERADAVLNAPPTPSDYVLRNAIILELRDTLAATNEALAACQAQAAGRIRELEALNAERNRQNALAFEERDRLRAKLHELAGECAECAGTGEAMTKRGIIEHVPCPECRHIRELLPEVTP